MSKKTWPLTNSQKELLDILSSQFRQTYFARLSSYMDELGISDEDKKSIQYKDGVFFIPDEEEVEDAS